MPPEDAPIESWSGASREEILLLVGGVVAAFVLTLAVYAVRRWAVRRREMRAFFAMVDSRHLSEGEEEAVRKLAADAKLARPSEILTSMATFDALAEAAIRKGMEGAESGAVQVQMDRLYAARAKLFPQGAGERPGNEGGVRDRSAGSPSPPVAVPPES